MQAGKWRGRYVASLAVIVGDHCVAPFSEASGPSFFAAAVQELFESISQTVQESREELDLRTWADLAVGCARAEQHWIPLVEFLERRIYTLDPEWAKPRERHQIQRLTGALGLIR